MDSSDLHELLMDLNRGRLCVEEVYDTIKSAMCEANSNAVLDDVAKLLTEYTQYLYEFGYLYDDWIMEAPCPIHEFINKKFGNVV